MGSGGGIVYDCRDGVIFCYSFLSQLMQRLCYLLSFAMESLQKKKSRTKRGELLGDFLKGSNE